MFCPTAASTSNLDVLNYSLARPVTATRAQLEKTEGCVRKVTVLVTEINEVVIYVESVERTRNYIYIHRLVTTLNELDEQEASWSHK